MSTPRVGRSVPKKIATPIAPMTTPTRMDMIAHVAIGALAVRLAAP